MPEDPAYDMPVRNWQQAGSFPSPLTLLLEDPDSSPLVQLPCINQTYVLALMGCLDQLRNPSTWDPASSPASIDGMLSRVTKLQEMMWAAMDTPCCNVTLRLTSTCVLQFSTNGGSTWTDVTDWATNFNPCVQKNITSPVPANPGSSPPITHACNIAGFLAQEIIKKTMAVMVSYVGTTQQQVQFGHDVLSTISFAFPITSAAYTAFYDFYNTVVGQLLAQVSSASTDPALWSAATCAIYNAIKAVGYVTPTNFTVAQANLHAMSYTYPWVPNAIGNYWGDLGVTNIQSLQNAGALDDVDCTGCTPWCVGYFTDTTLGTGWTDLGSIGGAYVPGSGWQSQYNSGLGQDMIALTAAFGTTLTLVEVDLGMAGSGIDSGGGPDHRAVQLLSGGSLVLQVLLSDAEILTQTKVVATFAPTACDTVNIVWSVDHGTGGALLNYIQLWGDGADPNPTHPCRF